MKGFLSSLIMLLVLALFAGTAFGFTKVSFQPYSTATPKTCSVIGLNVKTSVPDTITNPIASTARVLSLGNKGFRTYSAAALKVQVIKVECYSTAAPDTAAKVRMYLDSQEVVPTSSITLFISP